MRIKSVEAIVLRNPEPSIASAPSSRMVRLETDEGITGIGGACTHSERDEASSARVLVSTWSFSVFFIHAQVHCLSEGKP